MILYQHKPTVGNFDALPRSYRRAHSSHTLLSDARRLAARLGKCDAGFVLKFIVTEDGQLKSHCGKYLFNPAFFGLSTLPPAGTEVEVIM